MKSPKRMAMVVVVLCFIGFPVMATPVEWPTSLGGNGHFYEFVDTPGVTWLDCNDAAESVSYLGYQGHLVTLTSEAEHNFVYDTLIASTSANVVNIGGWQDPNNEIFDNWNWVTGEEWDYTNWASNLEGYDQSIVRDYLSLWGPAGQPGEQGKWKDTTNHMGLQYVDGYIVEYSVPEPATILILGSGILYLTRSKRKK